MVQMSSLLTSLRSSSANVGARPASAGDGVDITPWRLGGFAPRQALVTLDGSTGITLTAPASGLVGVEVWGLVFGAWKFFGSLNGQQQIVIASATLGFTEELDDLAAFTRLLIAGTPSTGTVAYTFCPLETWQ